MTISPTAQRILDALSETGATHAVVAEMLGTTVACVSYHVCAARRAGVPIPPRMIDGQPVERRTWTPERVEQLKDLWRGGYSAAGIARALNCGATRNAVIGKLNRLGLTMSGRPNSLRAKTAAKQSLIGPKRPRGRPERSKAARNIGQVFAPLPAISEPSTAHAVPIMGLRDSNMMTQCRWPLGEPSADMLYCGAPIEQGSYCAHHNRVAWKDAPPKLKYAWVG